MAYIVAWCVAVVAGILLITLCAYPLRRFRSLKWFVVVMLTFWLLVPWKFEDGFYAPLYIVLGFQTFLERDANPSSVLTFAILGSALITSIWLVLVAVNMYLKSKTKYKGMKL